MAAGPNHLRAGQYINPSLDQLAQGPTDSIESHQLEGHSLALRLHHALELVLQVAKSPIHRNNMNGKSTKVKTAHEKRKKSKRVTCGFSVSENQTFNKTN